MNVSPPKTFDICDNSVVITESQGKNIGALCNKMLNSISHKFIFVIDEHRGAR
jgi:hypothetical protein